jgi:hypothetical protein
VQQTTVMGLVALCLSIAIGGGGMGLVRHARAMPAPEQPAMRTLAGTVVSVVVAPCGNVNRRRTCYRPAVDYSDEGKRLQVVSRTAYSPSSPHKTGEKVTVLVEPNGTAWIASEWAERQAVRQRDYEGRRDFPLWMGWILVGCAGFSLLLGAGLIFFVDRSGDARS